MQIENYNYTRKDLLFFVLEKIETINLSVSKIEFVTDYIININNKEYYQRIDNKLVQVIFHDELLHTINCIDNINQEEVFESINMIVLHSQNHEFLHELLDYAYETNWLDYSDYMCNKSQFN